MNNPIEARNLYPCHLVTILRKKSHLNIAKEEIKIENFHFLESLPYFFFQSHGQIMNYFYRKTCSADFVKPQRKMSSTNSV